MVVPNKKKAIIVFPLAFVVLACVVFAVWYVISQDSKNGTSVGREDIQVQLNEAIALSVSGKCEEAVSRFEDVIAKSSEYTEVDAEARLRAGQCYMSLKKYQNAATLFDSAGKLFAELGDKPKQSQSELLYEQAAAESLNSVKSTEVQVKREGPVPSVPPEW
jgi:tetratricopeptide (TPR) repeat protein